MTKRRANVTVMKDFCKSCSLCVNICPKDVLAIAEDETNVRGYNPATVVNPDECIGCEGCELICPESAMIVERI